jgi:hypothetical protein
MTDAPDRIYAFDYDIAEDDGTWKNWTVWSVDNPSPINATQYLRADLAITLADHEAAVKAAVLAEREACAREAEYLRSQWINAGGFQGFATGAKIIADTIRDRGVKP